MASLPVVEQLQALDKFRARRGPRGPRRGVDELDLHPLVVAAGGKIICDAFAHRPANGEARAEIEDDRQIEPALAGRDDR